MKLPDGWEHSNVWGMPVRPAPLPFARLWCLLRGCKPAAKVLENGQLQVVCIRCWREA